MLWRLSRAWIRFGQNILQVWVGFSHCSVRRGLDSDRRIQPDPTSNSLHMYCHCCGFAVPVMPVLILWKTDMFPLQKCIFTGKHFWNLDSLIIIDTQQSEWNLWVSLQMIQNLFSIWSHLFSVFVKQTLCCSIAIYEKTENLLLCVWLLLTSLPETVRQKAAANSSQSGAH